MSRVNLLVDSLADTARDADTRLSAGGISVEVESGRVLLSVWQQAEPKTVQIRLSLSKLEARTLAAALMATRDNTF